MFQAALNAGVLKVVMLPLLPLFAQSCQARLSLPPCPSPVCCVPPVGMAGIDEQSSVDALDAPAVETLVVAVLLLVAAPPPATLPPLAGGPPIGALPPPDAPPGDATMVDFPPVAGVAPPAAVEVEPPATGLALLEVEPPATGLALLEVEPPAELLPPDPVVATEVFPPAASAPPEDSVVRVAEAPPTLSSVPTLLLPPELDASKLVLLDALVPPEVPEPGMIVPGVPSHPAAMVPRDNATTDRGNDLVRTTRLLPVAPMNGEDPKPPKRDRIPDVSGRKQ